VKAAWLGVARLGMAWRGVAWLGGARRGKARAPTEQQRMSTAYSESLTVESRAWPDFALWLETMSDDGQWCPCTFAREGNNQAAQMRLGDAMALVDGHSRWFEMKAEETAQHGNFFLETWSNRALFKPGWMLTSQCDFLCYYFLDEGLYVIDFGALRRWAFHERRLYRYPERCQGKRRQRNDSWGRCVPVSVVGDEVGFKVWRFEQGVWR
jgi:hypothetical protein